MIIALAPLFMSDTNPIIEPLAHWVQSCTNKGEVSRNTIAVGIVVLDHLRQKCPLEPTDVLSGRGEIKGARSGLPTILEKYDVPVRYLKEVTTRAGHQDGQRLFEAFKYGRSLAAIPQNQRDVFLKSGIESLVLRAKVWLGRQHLKINCDRQLSPAAWISNILVEAKGRSGGKVEQHLVGAKLSERHPEQAIPNNPGHAGDAQTGRPGDFVVGSTAYHVTAAPGLAVIEKCKLNLGAGLHPFLLVPREQVDRARHLSEAQAIADRMTIAAIEEFVAQNIIELSRGNQQEFVEILKSIIDKYNQRLEAVKTDLSLKIEIE
jgi:hypothetical protein